MLQLNSCKELHSISGLPNVRSLHVIDCKSLESVTYQSALTTPSIISSGCRKLKEVQGMFKFEPMEKVNREIIDNLGLCGVELIGNLGLSFKHWNTFFSLEENRRQGLYEFGIFSTFLRREEIPSWWGDRNDNKGSSSSISFVVPSHPSHRIRGLNVYSVYTLSNTNKIELPFRLFTKINNKTKDLKWIYTPVAIAIPEKENEDDQLVMLSHWKFGNHLESGDEFDVSVISGSEDLEVKEFGIKLVWGEEEEEEDMTANTDHHHKNIREVVGGDLSIYHFMSPRAFFLCHHYMHPSVTRILFQEVFGDHVTHEDFKRRQLARLVPWIYSFD